jgi:site-specific recombinase XerD
MFLFKRKGIYYLEYFDEMENRKKRISTKARLKKEALKFLTDFKESLNELKKVRYISVNDFRDEYIGYLKQSHSKSYVSLAKTAFKVLIKYTGNIPITKLNNRILEKLILENFNRTRHGARHYYINLNAAFNKAIIWGYLFDNPLKNFKLPKVPKPLPVFINNEELNNIVANTRTIDLRDIFITGFHTGMRLSEIINLKWSAINLAERTITVQNNESFTTKSKKERAIPINATLSNMLVKRYPKVLNINIDEYVFCKFPGVPYLKDFISKNFKKIVRRLGMSERIHFHILRHSFASNLVQSGVSLYVVKELLGHEDLSTTQIYSHLQKENLTNAVKVLDKAVL